MDGGRFDDMTRDVTSCGTEGSRRGVLRALAGGALVTALAVFEGPEDAEARRKKKKKKRCNKMNQRCTGHRKCCSKNCCFKNRGSAKICAPKTARCCPRQLGGGACRNNGSCCGPKPNYPRGSCCPRSTPNCCPGNIEGCCPAAFPACFGPGASNPGVLCCYAGTVPCFGPAGEPNWCCPVGALSAQSAAAPGVAAASQAAESAAPDSD